jgi:hypothetical protein
VYRLHRGPIGWSLRSSGREEPRRLGEEYLDRCIEVEDAYLPEPAKPESVEHWWVTYHAVLEEAKRTGWIAPPTEVVSMVDLVRSRSLPVGQRRGALAKAVRT